MVINCTKVHTDFKKKNQYILNIIMKDEPEQLTLNEKINRMYKNNFKNFLHNGK